ncbi:MAG TPA: alpha-(1-_3)-arabinofuranosyltransferase, partial [Pseudonocardiaceae bacterium]
MLGLTVVSLAQRPGLITFDTKLDLALDPRSFLGRALHLWNPEATFGELQNQAYGYLFPVGPFFVATEAVGVPTWVAQRLWCALLLCVAFGGTLLLARALGIGTEPARYVGAVSYALAPRVLTEIGPLSVEMLPAVLLPWVLLPLVGVHRLRSPRRAAALSGLAVFAMGGANAAMVLMALTLPGLWLLTRRLTAAHARLAAWWVVSVLAATLWWIVPLFLLAGYSLPFLDYIESAANTTAPLSLFQVLRGTNQWIAYVVQGEPWWPAGFMLVDDPVLMVATALVAGVGLLGLASRGLPERTFLLLGMLTGLVLLTMGHVGPLDSPVAEQVQRLLDGALAPLRNVHKFDPVLRLTLTLGLVHVVSRPAPAFATSPVSWRRAQVGLAAALVLVVATPAWLMTLRPGQGWTEVPPYWRQAAQYLAERDGSARTLMLPATGFGEYRWGRTVDEPLQALARAPWAVRNQIPLGSEGNTRFMDAVSDAVSDGRGSPALADFLARAGVRFLLLRNDVDRSSGTLPPVAVQRQALERSTGIRRVAAFGPEEPAAPLPGLLSRVDRDVPVPALEVYEVDREPSRVSVPPMADLVTVSGGPESVLPLLERGLLEPGRPTVLAGDSAFAFGERWVVTDGLRRRERNVGRVQGNVSQTLADTDPVRQERAVLDVLPFAGEEHQTVAQYQGVRAVEASSASGYADAFLETDPSYLPFAALDGDTSSQWRSSSYTGPVGQWLEVRLDTPRVFDQVTIDFAQDLAVGWPVARIRITTDRGSVEHDVPEAPGAHPYPVFAGPSDVVRVTVLGMRGGRENGNVAIRELTVPGVRPARLLRVPSDVDSARPPVLAFSRGSQPRAACYATDAGSLRCDPRLVRVGEEPGGVDRRFRLATTGLYAVTATALPRLAPQIWRGPSGLVVLPSSQLGGDPAVSPGMVLDDDPDTAWVADVSDPNPTLVLTWEGARTIDRIDVEPAALAGTNPPLAVTVVAGGETRTVQLDGRTAARFEPVTTTELQVSFRSADQSPFAGPEAGRGTASVAVGSLRVPALADLMPAGDELFAVGCGFGPPIEVDGTRYTTSVVGTARDVAGYRQLQVVPCGTLADEGLTLRPGDHRVRALPTDRFVVHDLTLTPLEPERPAGPAGRTVTVSAWDTALRTLEVSAGPDSLVVVPENANPGWVATFGGRELERMRVDGWQQAWFLPAGDGGRVTLEFRPDRSYRTALLAGGLLVLVLAGLALLPVRRSRTAPEPVATRSWWGVAIALTGLLLLLGGPVPVIALVACLAARHYRRDALPVVAAAGVVVAAGIAVAGRLLGHGQDWAFGPWPQLALFVTVAAVVAAHLYPADPAPARRRLRVDGPPP